MLKRLIVSFGILAAIALAQETTVRFKTNLGDIDVLMLRDSAPLTVANFLGYVSRGDYSNTVFHRSVPGFIVQGGGFNTSLGRINELSSVRNEYRESNLRGTVAMAKLGTSANSATNQWFFNLANNSANLNNQNGGFTVFGRVVNSAGLGIMDRIASVPLYNLGGAFDAIPLQNYRAGQQPTASNYIVVQSITVLGAATFVPTINDGGAVTLSNFGGFAAAAPGSFIEIYGVNFAQNTREWAGSDFTDGRAPTSLDDVSVTIGGQSAFVRFVSPGQLNVQVPANIPTGGQLPVVVTVKGQASPAAMLDIQATAPGLYAPPGFKSRDQQFVVPVRPATGALVNNGSVPGIPFSEAIPGETLLFYGVGFGQVDPATIPVAGQVVTASARLTVPVTIKIGGLDAPIAFAGLVQGSLGLYQLNVVIPAALSRGDHQVEVEVDGKPIRQTLFLPVQARPAP